jgi:DNA-binding NtrC family response regulator
MSKKIALCELADKHGGEEDWIMSKEYCFLLIGASPNDPWRQVIEGALTSWGVLQIVSEADVLRLTRRQNYDLIVIDATKVTDVFLLISKIKERKPNVKVVVATASPTWEKAREAFRAGATDYIWRSLNKEIIRSTLRAIVDKSQIS